MKTVDKNYLVVGLGETGFSVARWLLRQGASIRVVDSRLAPPNAERLRQLNSDIPVRFGDWNEEDFKWGDIWVVSPGVPLSEPIIQSGFLWGKKITGDVGLFYDLVRAWPIPPHLLAITGSNGKSTVTAMTSAILAKAGRKQACIGNIGVPVLDILEQDPCEFYVLELSSFQLETSPTMNLDGACITNISEDHLDRYASMDLYIKAKEKIYAGEVGCRVVNRGDKRCCSYIQANSVTFGCDEPSKASDWGLARIQDRLWIVRGSQQVLDTATLLVQGLHHYENVMVALALTQAVGIDLKQAVVAMQEFRGLPHRVEPVAEVAGVLYLDDSKGTNVGSTVAALKGAVRPCVVILGGDGKGQDFMPLRSAVMEHTKGVILIGRDAPLIAQVLHSFEPLSWAETLEDAVQQAAKWAVSGDQVLLSPACASFDMFRNYEHRAEVFRKAVLGLQSGVSS